VNGGASIACIADAEAARVDRSDRGMQVLDVANNLLAQGDGVILANGCQAQVLIAEHDLQLRPVRGQVTEIPLTSSDLRTPVCRDGYVTPGVNGIHYVGGTFDESVSAAVETEADHVTNYERAVRILPSVFGNADRDRRAGWAGIRCVSRDRVPVVGPVMDGVSACLGMGSRGFGWAPLAGEVLASAIVGASCPLEQSVATEILPGRLL
jgi:tRNA 5-methylaminomethyl-2-thiouridine biosynthesis bifunctional protein